MQYTPGQRWSYMTREGEIGSLVTILRVEELPDLGQVVFIAVDCLRVVDVRAAGGLRTEIRFTELTAEALDRSVTTLHSEGPVPEHEELYVGWRRSHDKGNATAYREPVAKIIGYFQQVCDSANTPKTRCEWRLMDTLPDLNWARLTVVPGGTAEVFDCDGRTHRFATEDEARFFLLEDEFRLWTLYEASDFADAPFRIDDVHPPAGSCDADLLPHMLVRWS